MSSITRQLVAIDILSEELNEYATQQGEIKDDVAESDYNKLLIQFTAQMKKLKQLSGEVSENEFSALVEGSLTCGHITNKQMLRIHTRLLGFIQDSYAADSKANALLSSDFGDRADERLGLLQTKGIKARAQYKTVAKALGEQDYHAFIRHAGLLVEHWGWKALRLTP